jgi:hypothetical protein
MWFKSFDDDRKIIGDEGDQDPLSSVAISWGRTVSPLNRFSGRVRSVNPFTAW